ncbi:hypothetical protein D9M68_605190 [compost metagenome]
MIWGLVGEVAPCFRQSCAQGCPAIRRGVVEAAVEVGLLVAIEILDVPKVVAAIYSSSIADRAEANAIARVEHRDRPPHGGAHQQVALAVVRVPVGVVLSVVGSAGDRDEGKNAARRVSRGSALVVEGVPDGATAGVYPAHFGLRAAVGVVVPVVEVCGATRRVITIDTCRCKNCIGVGRPISVERWRIGHQRIVGHAIALRGAVSIPAVATAVGHFVWHVVAVHASRVIENEQQIRLGLNRRECCQRLVREVGGCRFDHGSERPQQQRADHHRTTDGLPFVLAVEGRIGSICHDVEFFVSRAGGGASSSEMHNGFGEAGGVARTQHADHDAVVRAGCTTGKWLFGVVHLALLAHVGAAT